MFNINEFEHLDLTLNGGKITCFVDTLTGATLKSFHQKLTLRNVAKLYILKENETYLYVGTTMQSLTVRMRYGLTANGKRGYHGYKWKGKEKVKLYVWSFNGLTKIELENIEAELVFFIRKETGSWPLTQNEIHFNNNYAEGKVLAKEIFERLE
jgi:hypothetical protein